MWKKFGDCPVCGKRVELRKIDGTTKTHKNCQVKHVSGKNVKLEWRDKKNENTFN